MGDDAWQDVALLLGPADDPAEGGRVAPPAPRDAEARRAPLGERALPGSGSTTGSRVIADRCESPSRVFVRLEWEDALHQALGCVPRPRERATRRRVPVAR